MITASPTLRSTPKVVDVPVITLAVETVTVPVIVTSVFCALIVVLAAARLALVGIHKETFKLFPSSPAYFACQSP